MGKEPKNVEARILDAAARVFGRKVFHRASVQEIADLAGVGKGSVYRRFPDKLALLFAAGGTMMHNLAEKSMAVIDYDRPGKSITDVVKGYFAFCEENPHFQELIIQIRAAVLGGAGAGASVDLGMKEHDFTSLIAHAQKAGIVANLPPEDINYMIRSLLYGIVFFRHIPGRPKPSKALPGSVVRMISTGLLVGKPRSGRGAGRARTVLRGRK